MTPMLPHLATRTVAMPVEFFAALQTAAHDTRNPLAIDSVRDAGYRAGQALFEAFADWTLDRGEPDPDALPHHRFVALASVFFAELGWGELTFTPVSDSVMALDSDAWSEADGSGSGCLVSTGLFAGFFGRLADAPIAVLEVECRDGGCDRCRFLLGSIDVMGYVHEAMERGIPYERAAASA
ncbi:MAG: V4R domain-containing protein [Gemmatimonadota bacterium]